MLDGFQQTLTKTGIKVIGFEDNNYEVNSQQKLILSFTSIVLATAPIASQEIFNVEPEIKISGKYSQNENMRTFDMESSNKKNFYQGIHNNDTINMNNEVLEVDDLADKVTQTQLDEVKSHIDTKISSLESNLILRLENEKKDIITSLKEFISEENDKIKENKQTKTRFVLGSIVMPIVIALLTIYLTSN